MRIKKFLSKQSQKTPFVQRGQMMVLFALLIPVILLFTGLAFDLGWYYLNVSRMQNAADAAALAGASAIIDSNSAKLKDLSPVLIHLPEDNGLTDDGEPRVETSTETTTETSTTETDEGITTTTTETTTTTTTTISKTQLKDLNWSSGDATAKTYVAKNLAGNSATEGTILDRWNTSKDTADRQVDTNLNLVKVNGDFYYVVELGENIKHFFLSGLFGNMNAKVVAIAKLVPKDQIIVDTNTEVKTWEEFIAKIKDIINKNVIVGNWEVQNFYRQQKTIKVTDPETKEEITVYKYKNWDAYVARFDREQYTECWNHFQDLYNHFTQGEHIRRETVVVQDDLVVDSSGEPTRWGEKSNVAATKASINDDPSSKSYNPKVIDKKTYNTYAVGNDANPQEVGKPFTWQRLDSINIDFVPDVEIRDTSKYLSQDWDCFLPDADANDQSEVKGYSAHTAWQDGVDRSYLRIHNSIRFEAPYEVREDATDEDVLWGRIESEAMLYHPDAGNGLKGNVSIRSLNSVRQLIINLNQSNTATDSVTVTNDDGTQTQKLRYKYRPVILFYDGPERYSTENHIRDSKPIILNINAPFRMILYAPNSPVVIVGDRQQDFRGFVVAKKYVRLKTKDEFTFSHYKYYTSANRKEEYFATDQTDKDGNTIYLKANGSGNEKTESQLYKEEVYRSNDTNDTADYYKLTEDGLEMFTDNYGNVQFAELNATQSKIGEYDNFGRTDFTTHNYHVETFLEHNLLLSGK